MKSSRNNGLEMPFDPPFDTVFNRLLTLVAAFIRWSLQKLGKVRLIGVPRGTGKFSLRPVESMTFPIARLRLPVKSVALGCFGVSKFLSPGGIVSATLLFFPLQCRKGLRAGRT
jgi:hypothetical protein